MKIKSGLPPLERNESEAWILPVLEDQLLDHPVLRRVDEMAQGLLRALLDCGELKGKALEIHHLFRPAGLPVQRLLLVGAGKKSDWNCAALRRLAGTAWRALNARRVGKAVLWLPDDGDPERCCQVAAEGIAGAAYESGSFKTADPPEEHLQEVTLLVSDPRARKAAEKACETGTRIGAALRFTRSLTNEPSNCLTPEAFARKVQQMARRSGLRCRVLHERQLAALGMNCLLAVSRGSAQPPRLVLLEYNPSRRASAADLIALVGKGVTFDSGGISLKPADGMEEMKADMAGAAAVAGAMQAIAALKPACRVLGVLPCVENMPGGSAARPGDVVQARNGKTVEIINTDAEGRLILADAISLAAERRPAALIDIATLTGACKVALGTVYAGLFASDQALADQLLSLADFTGEKLWRLPLDAEYSRPLQSDIADLRNIGTRWGGAVYGAMFLQNFVPPIPWAHLDIAGVDWLAEGTPYQAKGPTGFGFRTLVEFVLRYRPAAGKKARIPAR